MVGASSTVLMKAWVLHPKIRQSFVVLDGLRRLCKVSMPLQVELNEVTAH